MTNSTILTTMDSTRKENQNMQCELIKSSQLTDSLRRARKLAKFYENKNILVTGATGFVGKVCLVKLVSSLSGCGKIYVMLRSKRGLSSQQRFNKMLNEAPFDSLKSTVEGQENSIDWSKVVAVDGDMSAEDLGVSADWKAEICENVNVVFNIAASVQFDAPLKQNLRDNYLGAQNSLKLASQMKRLESFVHVSTFYTNTHIKHVEEKVLPLNRDCEKMAELISWMPDSLCDAVTGEIMEDRPNTYVFTKAMAENLVQKYQGKFPIAIVRPSIVTPSIKDPIPGWVDNVNGPMGLGVLASLGILRNIDWNYYGVCDLVPVDVVVNSMIAVAERTPRLYPNEIKVYNCSTSSLRPTTWGAGFEILREESLKAPPYKMLRIPIEVPKHRRANKVGFMFTKLSELLFAYFIDFILRIFQQKPLLSKLTARLHRGYDVLRPFTTTEYTCSNENFVQAFEELEEQDKQQFDFDVRKLDWDSIFRTAYYGARLRLLKEDMSNVNAALVKMRVLYAFEMLFKVLFIGLASWTSYRIYSHLAQKVTLSI